MFYFFNSITFQHHNVFDVVHFLIYTFARFTFLALYIFGGIPFRRWRQAVVIARLVENQHIGRVLEPPPFAPIR